MKPAGTIETNSFTAAAEREGDRLHERAQVALLRTVDLPDPGQIPAKELKEALIIVFSDSAQTLEEKLQTLADAA